jgi:hypothetical protein
VAAALWPVLNASYVVWIYYYLQTATRPNPHTAVNKTPSGWIGFYIMMYISGFCLGVINILVVLYARNVLDQFFEIGDEAKTPRRVITRLLYTFILLPVAIILIFGPLFSPVAGLKLLQWHQWYHKCDSFAGEVVLAGRLYSAPETAAATASFFFWRNNVRTEYYQYDLFQNPDDSNNWQLQLGQLFNSPPQTSALAQNISYELSNNTFSAICAPSPNANGEAAIPCLEGSFNPKGYLSFTITDIATNATTQLEAIDSYWDFSKTNDAPNFILKEVQADGHLGSISIESAVTKPQDCSSLKVCIADDEDELFVPIGLILMQQDAYSRTCTTPNSN